MTQENSLRITNRSTVGAITSEEYRADPFFDATAHLKKSSPAKFSGGGRKTRPPADFIRGKYRRGGAHVLRRGRFFEGRFHFAIPAVPVSKWHGICRVCRMHRRHWTPRGKIIACNYFKRRRMLK